MSTLTAPAPTGTDPRSKLQAIADIVRTEVVGLDAFIDMLCLAIVSKSNLFVLGEPGIAKTMTAERFFKRIVATLFEIQLGKFTLDGEVLGPVDVPGLQAGRQRRNPLGYLPAAHYAILDELFKSGSALRNMLLRAINENEWRNDGEMHDLLLNIVVGLANEGPNEGNSEDGAFLDRFTLRFVADDTLDRDALRSLLLLPPVEKNPPALITHDEILAIQAEAIALPLTDAALDALLDIHQKVTDAGLRPSPRRFRSCVRVVQGQAWLAGADEVGVEHVEVVDAVLWQRPEQQPVVNRIVLEVCAPGQEAVLNLADEVAAIAPQIDALDAEIKATSRDKADASAKGIAISDLLVDAGISHQRLAAQNLAGRAAQRLDAVKVDIETMFVRAFDLAFAMPTSPAMFWTKVDEKAAQS